MDGGDATPGAAEAPFAAAWAAAICAIGMRRRSRSQSTCSTPRTMEMLQSYSSPLFGRMTGQWQVEPLPFVALKQFFPNWTIDERVALYSIVGGVAAYLDWLNPNLNLINNLYQVHTISNYTNVDLQTHRCHRMPIRF